MEQKNKDHKTIAVINQKGGVGKSTTALAIGQGLLLKGYKVLVIDLDAQGSISYAMGADSKGYGTMGILERPETAPKEIQHTESGDIIASSPALAGADLVLSGVGAEYKLKEALENLKKEYNYIVIDTPPTLNILTINALTASTGAIIPAQADIFSLQGIAQLYSTIESVKKYTNKDLSIMGIVLTRYNKRAVISRDITAGLEQTAEAIKSKVYKTTIRECTALKEAQAMRESIYSYAPKSNATADYKALVEEIVKE